jgi:hypothetical protein
MAGTAFMHVARSPATTKYEVNLIEIAVPMPPRMVLRY